MAACITAQVTDRVIVAILQSARCCCQAASLRMPKQVKWITLRRLDWTPWHELGVVEAFGGNA
eukprot:325071-Chlamydomonas_euryale.AAC.9